MRLIQKFRNLERETKLDIVELSRGYLGVLIISIFMWNICVASALYSGGNYTFTTNLTNPVYTVTGNSSDLTGLTVSFENGNITISTDLLMKSDSFSMIFFDEVTKEVIKEVYVGGSGGSGGSTEYIKENVTVYVPEYVNKIVNDTEIVEVEKIIDKIIYQRDYSFSIWIAFLSCIFCVMISQIISYWYYKKENKKIIEKIAKR